MSKRLPSRTEVLEFMRTDDRAFHAKEIAANLDVSDASYNGLLAVLDNLVFDGLVIARDGHRFKLTAPRTKGLAHREGNESVTASGARATLEAGSEARTSRAPAASARTGREPRPSPRAPGAKGTPGAETRPSAPVGSGARSPLGRDQREGTVSVNARGFGFVASLGATGDDVFVTREGLHGAMHGDKVIVTVRARGPRGVEGEIDRVVTRAIKRVAGVLRRRGRSAWLEPDDTRVRGPIPLPDDIDTREGEGNSGKDGDAAVITITRYPELPDETPVGKLEAVLGTPGEIKVEVAKILVVAQIEEVHSDDAIDEARAYGDAVPTEMLEGRDDLTHLPLPTIDPEDARDHDDAVWVERLPGGGYRAWVAIADVSSYVRPGTQIDAESIVRGCSVYLPDRAIPMLPRPLSSNLCSLLPDVVRLCLCAVMDVDPSGNVKHAEMRRAFMKSQAKLTYGGVARALGFTEAPPRDPRADALVDGLRVADELSRILRRKRLQRGALDFDLPEAKVVLAPDGNPADVERRSQDPGMKKAYQLIEELMLLANETVAKWLFDRQIPTIYRVHAPPDAKKLEKLTAMCEALGVEFDLSDAQDPKKLSLVLKQFADHPNAQVLNMLLLRSMKQATYDVVNVGHFGLASKQYLHFTSPIRRYPDLVVHRAVHAEVQGRRPPRGDDAVQKLGEAALAASTAERKAMEVEREVVDLYRAVLMRDKIGERFEGTVTGMVGSGVFVALDAPFVDVLVRLEDLGGDRYEMDDEGLRAVASRSGDVVALGDRMGVEIIDVAILRRSVYGRRIGHGAASSEGATRGDGARPRKRAGHVVEALPPGKRRETRGEKDVEKRIRGAKRKLATRPGKSAPAGSKTTGAGKKKGPARKGKKKR